MTNIDSDAYGEFEITFATMDTVCAEEMRPEGAARIPFMPRDVAIFAVQRLMDGVGPDLLVDVRDEDGATHRFEVYRWNGEWTCEARAEDFPDLAALVRPPTSRGNSPATPLANHPGLDLTDIPDDALDGLPADQQRDLVRASAHALRAWAEELRHRGIW